MANNSVKSLLAAAAIDQAFKEKMAACYPSSAACSEDYFFTKNIYINITRPEIPEDCHTPPQRSEDWIQTHHKSTHLLQHPLHIQTHQKD